MITLEARREYRDTIQRLTALNTAIEDALKTGKPLPNDIARVLRQLAQTDSTENQFLAIGHLLEETSQEYMGKLLEAAPSSLSCFYEFLNPHEPPARHHEFIVKQLEAIERKELMQAIFSLPPGYAKSTYCTHYFPAWYMGRHPNHQYMQAGHTQEFVDKEYGLRTKNIIQREDFQKVFPEFKLSTDSKAAGSWSVAGKVGRYTARGIGAGISGFRANVAAVDDPYPSRMEAESPAYRKKVYDWLMADFMNRLLPRSPMFIVATRWHPLDICGVLEEMSKEGKGAPWSIINLPAIAEGDDDPLGRADGEALWPEFYSLESLLTKRATMPSRDWNSLFMGKPVDEDGGALLGSWLHRYTKMPQNEADDHGHVTKLNIRRTTVSVDCASKDGQRNDYTVITVWLEDAFGKHYLVDVMRDRLQFEPMCAAIDAKARKWRADAILVEDKGSGTQYIQVSAGKSVAPVIPISTNNDSKAFRFDGVTPMFQSGDVLLPEQSSWLADYERELLQFPSGAYDDQVDSTSQYLAWARQGRRLGTRKLLGAGTNHEAMVAARDTEGGLQAPVAGARPSIMKPGRPGRFNLTQVATPSAPIAG